MIGQRLNWTVRVRTHRQADGQAGGSRRNSSTDKIAQLNYCVNIGKIGIHLDNLFRRQQHDIGAQRPVSRAAATATVGGSSGSGSVQYN